MAVLNRFYQALYSCPIVRLSGFARELGLHTAPLAYLDFGGATGTAKDGLAEGMLALAAQRGDLTAGMPVADVACGNFASALTIAAQASGHPVYLTAPRDFSVQRQEQLEALGARMLFSGELEGWSGAGALAKETARLESGYYVNHLANDDNPEYHRRITGPRILEEIESAGIDAIIAGVGSGGTISGVGEVVKAWHNEVRIVAVEPYESQALSGGFTGTHTIPGIGLGFVPDNYNPYIVDRVIAVTSGQARRTAGQVLHTDGIPAAPSAGAVLYAAQQLLESGQAKQPLCIFSGRTLYQ